MGGVTRRSDFAQRLRQGAPLAGTFQKTPAYQIVELLGQSGLDFVVLDTEHAPFDPSQIDACMLASHAADLPLVVRVARNEPDAILSALDMGASGVFIPHARAAADASHAASAARYIGGSRGFSPSTRAGAYGKRGLHGYMEAADREVAVVLQIEDAEALDDLGAIAAVDGITGLFLGRADLAVSMAADWNDPRLDEATRRMSDACRSAGIAAGAYLADTSRLAEYLAWGLSFFVIGSDQGSLRAEGARSAAAFAEILNRRESA